MAEEEKEVDDGVTMDLAVRSGTKAGEGDGVVEELARVLLAVVADVGVDFLPRVDPVDFDEDAAAAEAAAAALPLSPPRFDEAAVKEEKAENVPMLSKSSSNVFCSCSSCTRQLSFSSRNDSKSSFNLMRKKRA